MRVLVVEDHEDLRRSVVARLRSAGFGADEAADLPEAEVAADVTTYDCFVLDRMLPSGDAVELLQELRRRGNAVPALFLTARDDRDDRLEGFAAGGDDYVTKPFDLDELVARVTTLCRRRADMQPVVLRVADLEIDTARRQVRRGGVRLPLTAKELALLELLARAAPAVVPRAVIAERCWDEDTDPSANTIDVHLASLRRKLGAPPLVHTRRGEGVVLALEP